MSHTSLRVNSLVFRDDKIEGMNVLVRKAKLKDLPAIVELSMALSRYHEERFDRDYYAVSPKAEEYLRKHRKAQIHSKNSIIFVAEADGEIVGFTSGSIKKSKPLFKSKNYGQLGSGFVKEKYRGMGIGKKLAESILDWAKAKGVKFVVVSTSIRNRLGVGAVKGLGFKELECKLIKNLK